MKHRSDLMSILMIYEQNIYRNFTVKVLLAKVIYYQKANPTSVCRCCRFANWPFCNRFKKHFKWVATVRAILNLESARTWYFNNQAVFNIFSIILIMWTSMFLSIGNNSEFIEFKKYIYRLRRIKVVSSKYISQWRPPYYWLKKKIFDYLKY